MSNPPQSEENQASSSQQQSNSIGSSSNNNPPAWVAQLAEAMKPSTPTKLTVAPPAKFSADASQHATTFINSMDVYFTLQQSTGGKVITDKEKVLHTMLNTEGPAQLWVQNYISTYPDSDFGAFKASFLQRFTPTNESTEALKFLQQHIRVIARSDLKQAIDQYNALFLQKKELVHGVHEQVFSLAYVSHLPRTLQGYVESKIREWQTANPLSVAVGDGQPPLNTVIEYTTAAIPLCQTQWFTSERRYAVKKDSPSRMDTASVLQSDGDTRMSNTSHNTTPSAISTSVVGSYSNRFRRGGDGNGGRFNNRGPPRRSTVPQWVIDYCRSNRLCFKCKEPFTPETHPVGSQCTRPFKRLDDKLRPRSN